MAGASSALIPSMNSDVESTESPAAARRGAPSTPFTVFLAGESVAASLTSTCNGDIVAAQVFWGSQLGGAPDSLESSISLLGAGSFPTPGAPLVNQGGGNAGVLGATLQDGVMNEYRFLAPPLNSVPSIVSVTNGQTFVVSLTFLDTNSGNAFAPSVVADPDGCQGSTNAVDVLPGGGTTPARWASPETG